MLPSRALIVRAEEAGAILLRRTNQVDAPSIGVHRDGHANAPGRKGVRFDFRPRFPSINGLEQLSVTRPSRALTRAAASAAGGSARLSLSRSKNHIRHVEWRGEIAAAGFIVYMQHVGPGLAAIVGAEDAALCALSAAHRNDDHDVGVLGVDDDLRDPARPIEADVSPR